MGYTPKALKQHIELPMVIFSYVMYTMMCCSVPSSMHFLSPYVTHIGVPGCMPFLTVLLPSLSFVSYACIILLGITNGHIFVHHLCHDVLQCTKLYALPFTICDPYWCTGLYALPNSIIQCANLKSFRLKTYFL